MIDSILIHHQFIIFLFVFFVARGQTSYPLSTHKSLNYLWRRKFKLKFNWQNFYWTKKKKPIKTLRNFRMRPSRLNSLVKLVNNKGESALQSISSVPTLYSLYMCAKVNTSIACLYCKPFSQLFVPCAKILGALRAFIMRNLLTVYVPMCVGFTAFFPFDAKLFS